MCYQAQAIKSKFYVRKIILAIFFYLGYTSSNTQGLLLDVRLGITFGRLLRIPCVPGIDVDLCLQDKCFTLYIITPDFYIPHFKLISGYDLYN